MTGTVVLLPFDDPDRRRHWLDYIEPVLERVMPARRERWVPDAWPCRRETSYAERLAGWFGVRGGVELVIVEHDVWPTDRQLAALLDSPFPITTVPYLMSKGLPPHWTADAGYSVRFDGVLDWAILTGIGLIRFSALAVERIGARLPADFPHRDWTNLDAPICQAARDGQVPIRVQWPAVRHSAQAP